MSDQPISMSRSGPPETILPAVDVAIMHALRQALATSVDSRRAAVASVVAKHPTCLHAWAALGRASTPGIDAYMAFRVGYHRPPRSMMTANSPADISRIDTAGEPSDARRAER
ncbi:MAG: hypothetical protein EBX87_04235 [Actinobacteria bacterium]|nr:hypothetical protein [Actinomycetota bacterium]